MPERDVPDHGKKQYLTFQVEQQKCALYVGEVCEVIVYSPLTNIPGMEEWFSGVFNMRGKAVPVIDLKYRIGKSKSIPDDDSAIIVTQPKGWSDRSLQVGILVDAVHTVMDLYSDQIQPVPTVGVSLDLSFMEGVVEEKGDFLFLVDLKKVLNKKAEQESEERSE